jgi:hypothetical protein
VPPPPILARGYKVTDKETYDYREVGLCKETLAMWAKLGMDYRKIKCTCV